MTNIKHIEHPEDTILTGDLDILGWFQSPGRLSVKICLLYTSDAADE